MCWAVGCALVTCDSAQREVWIPRLLKCKKQSLEPHKACTVAIEQAVSHAAACTTNCAKTFRVQRRLDSEVVMGS